MLDGMLWNAQLLRFCPDGFESLEAASNLRVHTHDTQCFISAPATIEIRILFARNLIALAGGRPGRRHESCTARQQPRIRHQDLQDASPYPGRRPRAD